MGVPACPLGPITSAMCGGAASAAQAHRTADAAASRACKITAPARAVRFLASSSSRRAHLRTNPTQSCMQLPHSAHSVGRGSAKRDHAAGQGRAGHICGCGCATIMLARASAACGGAHHRSAGAANRRSAAPTTPRPRLRKQRYKMQHSRCNIQTVRLVGRVQLPTHLGLGRAIARSAAPRRSLRISRIIGWRRRTGSAARPRPAHLRGPWRPAARRQRKRPRGHRRSSGR